MNIFVIGTRAQLIKVAPVIRIFETSRKPLIIILTGQHNDTMKDLMSEFGITTAPIKLIQDKEHASVVALLRWLPQTFRLLLSTLNEYESGYVFIHGDTLTTFLSAITSKIAKKNIVHLESGLTSNKLFSPFPEEVIRRIVFRYTDIAFCPTLKDVYNLNRYSKIKTVHTHGNTILDSIHYLKVGENTHVSKNSILVSLHRFQNIYNKKRLKKITNLIIKLANIYQVTFVLHPATHKNLIKFQLINSLKNNSNINLTPRMTYKKFLNLALSNEIVITDGGSNQEEMAFFGHPTIILRGTTERQDGLSENAILIDDPESIYKYITMKKYLELKKQKIDLDISPSEVIYRYFNDIN